MEEKSETTTTTLGGGKKSKVVIVGGGIAGLVVALGLKVHGDEKFEIEVYEQAKGYVDGVGGAIGLYPNGLRVLQTVLPSHLFHKLTEEYGYPYLYRRWYRHDGTQVASANETETLSSDELQPLGIRRYQLQNVLLQAVRDANIPLMTNKHVSHITQTTTTTTDNVTLTFADGDVIMADYVFGADGIKSKVRNSILPSTDTDTTTTNNNTPIFTGVTCIMGAATGRSDYKLPRGISFPSSITTKCHMCTYPTSDKERIFQLYVPTLEENPNQWGSVSQEEINELICQLEKDGWDEELFLSTIREADPKSLIRVGLKACEPMSTWYHNRVVLLGDAAHPPVPYIGQGAMMAMEDAGTLSLLVSQMDNFQDACHIYQTMRKPRAQQILQSSHVLGQIQQKRAESWIYNLYKELHIKYQVWKDGTLPILKPGALYNYHTHTHEQIQHFQQQKETKLSESKE